MDKTAVAFWVTAATLAAAWLALPERHPDFLQTGEPVRLAPLDQPSSMQPRARQQEIVPAVPPARSTYSASSAGAVHAAERAWLARVAAFEQQVAIARERSADPGELALVRQRLRETHFNPEEQVLLDTYLQPAAPTLTRQ